MYSGILKVIIFSTFKTVDLCRVGAERTRILPLPSALIMFCHMHQDSVDAHYCKSRELVRTFSDTSR